MRSHEVVDVVIMASHKKTPQSQEGGGAMGYHCPRCGEIYHIEVPALKDFDPSHRISECWAMHLEQDHDIDHMWFVHDSDIIGDLMELEDAIWPQDVTPVEPKSPHE